MGGLFSQPEEKKVNEEEEEDEYEDEYEDEASLMAKQGNLIYKIIKRSVLKHNFKILTSLLRNVMQ